MTDEEYDQLLEEVVEDEMDFYCKSLFGLAVPDPLEEIWGM